MDAFQKKSQIEAVLGKVDALKGSPEFKAYEAAVAALVGKIGVLEVEIGEVAADMPESRSLAKLSRAATKLGRITKGPAQMDGALSSLTKSLKSVEAAYAPAYDDEGDAVESDDEDSGEFDGTDE